VTEAANRKRRKALRRPVPCYFPTHSLRLLASPVSMRVLRLDFFSRENILC